MEQPKFIHLLYVPTMACNMQCKYCYLEDNTKDEDTKYTPIETLKYAVDKLKKDNIQTEKEANKTHYNIGKNIREVIEKNGGTMPEDLPTPEKSLKQLEKEKNNMLKNNK